ncbi:hypothetical protein IWW36_002079 [Coemansia brasiliensis]|uniref:Uncharacterized protein n=1 Tax=Coemansia brasiliensis TaxID=2650707 RepID=A0A9W8I7T6_9FUNG|nr:hypothetical protein IWW36_002079 [Coemansia brasiliensis]
MNNGYASGAETPLSASFQDTAFMSFIHEADKRNNAESPLADLRKGSRKHQLQQPTRIGEPYTSQLAGEGNVTSSKGHTHEVGTSAAINGNDDDDWSELDNLELDSQTMKQLIETEEEFYATQQFVSNTDLQLSQDFADPPHAASSKAHLSKRSTSAGGPYDAHNARAVPSPAAQSVPVTPTAAHLAYISDSESAQSSRGASGSNVPQNRNLQPRQPLNRYSSASGVESMAHKTNLYSRLAAHIPPRPPVPRNDRKRPHSGSSEIRFDLGTSMLSSPSTERQASVPQSSRLTDVAVAQRLETMSEEIRRLKEENLRAQAESESLRAQLYTREGEVKIVRENLARTEIENTHLQERLANQISSATAAQRQAEANLTAEIERLRTELLFKQHEAKTGQTPVRSSSNTPRTGNVRSQSSGRNLSTGPNVYPEIDEFMPTPRRTLTKASQSLSPDSIPKQTLPQQQQQLKRDQGVSTREHSYPEAISPLLEILTNIAKLPNTVFSGLVQLASQLPKAVRSPELIQDFHELACTIVHQISSASSYEQLEAVLRLLLQTIDRLPETRDLWLLNQNGTNRLGQLSAVACQALQVDVKAAAQLQRRSQKSLCCGRAIAANTRLLVRLIGLQPAAALDSETWNSFDPDVFTRHLVPSITLCGLSGILELLTTLVQASPFVWRQLRDMPKKFEDLMLAFIKRLRLAFAQDEPQMLDSQHKLLVLIASAIVTHEEDSSALINSSRRFTRALIQWFIDEHLALTSNRNVVDDKRVAVLCEHMRCLNVILSEVDDVVALLDGDTSPMYYAFVAAATRITFGESSLARSEAIGELAADLLAYAVTEEQALTIQSLAEF